MLQDCGLMRVTRRPSIVLIECGRRDRFEHRAKNKTAFLQSGTREVITLTGNIWQSHETTFMAGIRFVRRGISLVDV